MMYKFKIWLATILLWYASIWGYTQELPDFFRATDHFLRLHVHQGRVDYKTIREEPQNLDRLLLMAKTIQVQPTNTDNYMAFWINTYNLSVIKGIVDHYPITSPLEVDGFFDTIQYDIGGKQRTLNDMENNLLRAIFPNEARFHFVLVCAGLGCPPLIPGAYLPDTLEAQLQQQTERALNDPDFVRVEKKKIGLSQIFEWYHDDFVRNKASVLDFINTYRSEKIDNSLKVYFYPYNWSLNDIAH